MYLCADIYIFNPYQIKGETPIGQNIYLMNKRQIKK